MVKHQNYLTATSSAQSFCFEKKHDQTDNSSLGNLGVIPDSTLFILFLHCIIATFLNAFVNRCSRGSQPQSLLSDTSATTSSLTTNLGAAGGDHEFSYYYKAQISEPSQKAIFGSQHWTRMPSPSLLSPAFVTEPEHSGEQLYEESSHPWGEMHVTAPTLLQQISFSETQAPPQQLHLHLRSASVSTRFGYRSRSQDASVIHEGGIVETDSHQHPETPTNEEFGTPISIERTSTMHSEAVVTIGSGSNNPPVSDSRNITPETSVASSPRHRPDTSSSASCVDDGSDLGVNPVEEHHENINDLCSFSSHNPNTSAASQSPLQPDFITQNLQVSGKLMEHTQIPSVALSGVMHKDLSSPCSVSHDEFRVPPSIIETDAGSTQIGSPAHLRERKNTSVQFSTDTKAHEPLLPSREHKLTVHRIRQKELGNETDPVPRCCSFFPCSLVLNGFYAAIVGMTQISVLDVAHNNQALEFFMLFKGLLYLVALSYLVPTSSTGWNRFCVVSSAALAGGVANLLVFRLTSLLLSAHPLEWPWIIRRLLLTFPWVRYTVLLSSVQKDENNETYSNHKITGGHGGMLPGKSRSATTVVTMAGSEGSSESLETSACTSPLTETESNNASFPKAKKQRNIRDAMAAVDVIASESSSMDKLAISLGLDTWMFKLVGNTVTDVVHGATAFTLYGALLPSLAFFAFPALIVFFPLWAVWFYIFIHLVRVCRGAVARAVRCDADFAARVWTSSSTDGRGSPCGRSSAAIGTMEKCSPPRRGMFISILSRVILSFWISIPAQSLFVLGVLLYDSSIDSSSSNNSRESFLGAVTAFPQVLYTKAVTAIKSEVDWRLTSGISWRPQQCPPAYTHECQELLCTTRGRLIVYVAELSQIFP